MIFRERFCCPVDFHVSARAFALSALRLSGKMTSGELLLASTQLVHGAAHIHQHGTGRPT